MSSLSTGIIIGLGIAFFIKLYSNHTIYGCPECSFHVISNPTLGRTEDESAHCSNCGEQICKLGTRKDRWFYNIGERSNWEPLNDTPGAGEDE